MKVLITGAAGFIGFHLSRRLIQSGYKVVGIDNLNDYYAVSLKEDRLKLLMEASDFRFEKMDILHMNQLEQLFKTESFDFVVHLAAQASVRYSLINPRAYIENNSTGFFNILESCRQYPVKHLLYASSSSVYGGNTTMPFSANQSVDHPVSLYAATKKSNELIAHAYSHLYDLPTTGLRFFTVYGPYGRPDMAYYSFTQKIIADETITLFNQGKMERDFTYVEDIVEAIDRLLLKIPEKNKAWKEASGLLSESFAPYKIYNIGNNRPVQLEKFISLLEDNIGKQGKKSYEAMPLGEIESTCADITDLEKAIGFKPTTSIEVGISHFIQWYLSYYKPTL